MLSFRLEGPDTPGRLVQVERLPWRIGRHRDNGLALTGWRVAREHAELRRVGTGVHLVDLGSLGGTWVNGNRVHEFGPLQEADEIAIGGFRLQVRHVARMFGANRRDEPVASPDDSGEQGGPSARARGESLPDERMAGIPARSAVDRDPSHGILDATAFPTGSSASPTGPNAASTARPDAAFELRRLAHRLLLETIDLRRTDVRQFSDAQLRADVRAMVEDIVSHRIDAPEHVDRAQLIEDVVDEAVGLGPLQRLLADPDISEIMVNRADEIYVERAGRIERCTAAFTGDAAVRGVIDRIVAPLGRRIDEASPMVDARLPDGSRVNAIIPPLALKGPAITIRRFGRRVFTPGELVGRGSASAAMVDFLRLCIEHRRSIVVSGGTGSGKTSLLNVLSNFIPAGERLITIEDAAELRLRHPHLVGLEARPANAEGRGAVTIRDLVRNALRMRPDRIIVGECRGSEAIDMLQAMNTGHEGSLTTVHANGARDALARLETMILMADVGMPLTAVREQIASAIDVIVHQARAADGSRRIVRIAEVTGIEAGRIQTADLFSFEQRGLDAAGRPVGEFRASGLVPSFFDELRAAGFEPDVRAFRREIA